MQIYVIKDRQEFEISKYVSAMYQAGRLTINFNGKISSCPAKIGSTFVIKRYDDNLDVHEIQLSDQYVERVGYCLSFEPKKCCATFEEFNARLPEAKKGYPSPKFFMHTNERSYAFLVAKKKDSGRKYSPILFWIDPSITPEEMDELIHRYRKYRKIWHDLTFTSFIMNQK